MNLPRDDDDRVPGLPPVDGHAEEPLGVDDEDGGDDAIGRDDSEEDIGLDATTGPDDADDDELLGEGDEGGSLIADSEVAGDEVGEGNEVDAEGEEGGWVADSEAEEGEFGEDEGLADDEALGGGDAGEEGVDEDPREDAADDDASALPPLREAEEALDGASEDLDLEEEANVEGAMTLEQEQRSSGGTLPAPLPETICQVVHLGPEDDAIVSIAIQGSDVWGCGETLYRTHDTTLEAVDPDGLEGQELTSIAIDPRDPQRMAAGTRLAGALRSTDAGRSFVPSAGRLAAEASHLSTAVYVIAEPHPGGVRLWARTRAGALYRSDDFAASWHGPMLISPVSALAADPRGGVVVLCVPRVGPLQVARTDDGGLRWTMRQGPERAAETPLEFHLDVLDDVIAVSCDADPEGISISRDAGATFARIPSLSPAGPVALIREEGRIVVYAALFFAGVDRGVVIRRDALGGEATVLNVARERADRHLEGRGDAEGDNRVFAIRARHEGGTTTLHAATGAGVFAVRIDLSGGRRDPSRPTER
jgi:hypothetical protein